MFYWPHLVRLQLCFGNPVGPSRPLSECAQRSCPSTRYKGFLGSARMVTCLLHFGTKRGKRSASRPDRLTPWERTIATH